MTKIKTFVDKQRTFTKQEEALLEVHRKKKSGRKTKEDGLILPDSGIMKDDTFQANTDHGNEHEGKLITEADLEREKREELAERKRYEESFKKQLKEWSEDLDFSVYDFAELEHSDYLVRLFKMDISEFKGFISVEYEWSEFLKSFKLVDVPTMNTVYPIAKIMKIGDGVESERYKVGDLVIVPSSEVTGEDWNPKFLHVMQFQNSQNMKPVLPDGMKQNIPNVEKHWERYKFIKPWLPSPDEEDNLTYLIPTSKVKGKYIIK